MMPEMGGDPRSKLLTIAQKSRQPWFGVIAVAIAAVASYAVDIIFDVAASTGLLVFCGTGILLSGLVKRLHRIVRSSANVDDEVPK